jgi:hypothetical protein
MNGSPGQHRWDAFWLLKDDEFLDSAAPGSLTLNFPCPDKTRCGGKESVSLTISPEKESNSHEWQGSLSGSAKGNFVARVVNNEKVPYGPWQLEPEDKVYLWVGDDEQKKPALYRVSSWNPANKPDRIFVFANWQHCPLPTQYPPEVHDQPYGCPGQSGGIVGGGLWMSCSSGCCQIRTT